MSPALAQRGSSTTSFSSDGQNNPANKYIATPSDDYDDMEDDFSSNRRRTDGMRDGGLRGVGESPIVLDYQRSQSEGADSRHEEISDLDDTQNKVMTLLEEDDSSSSQTRREKVQKKSEVNQGRIDVLSRHSDDPETDNEVARVLAVEEITPMHSSSNEKVKVGVDREDTNSENTMEHVPSDEEVEDYNSLTFLQHLQSRQQVTLVSFGLDVCWCGCE